MFDVLSTVEYDAVAVLCKKSGRWTDWAPKAERPSTSTKHPDPFPPSRHLSWTYLSCLPHRVLPRGTRLLCEVDHNRSVAVAPRCYVVVQLERRGQLCHHLNNHRLLPVPGHVNGHPVEGARSWGLFLGRPCMGESKEKRGKEHSLQHFEAWRWIRHMWEGVPLYWGGRGGRAPMCGSSPCQDVTQWVHEHLASCESSGAGGRDGSESSSKIPPEMIGLQTSPAESRAVSKLRKSCVSGDAPHTG